MALTQPRVAWAMRVVGGKMSGGRVDNSLWLESPLDDHWVAAFRLLVQDGQVVVGELRVFPDSGQRQRAGEWEAEEQGMAVRVPGDGLTAQLLRKVRVGDHVALPRTIARTLRTMQGGLPPGFPDFDKVETPTVASTPAAPKRGRRPHSPVHLAEVARDYVQSLAEGDEDPVARLADDHRVSRACMAGWIRRARVQGLLTPTRRGRMGGELTRAATALLGK